MDELQRLADGHSTAVLTNEAAEALVELYGRFNADFVAVALSAGWMTDAERRCFEPLVQRLRELA